MKIIIIKRQRADYSPFDDYQDVLTPFQIIDYLEGREYLDSSEDEDEEAWILKHGRPPPPQQHGDRHFYGWQLKDVLAEEGRIDYPFQWDMTVGGGPGVISIRGTGFDPAKKEQRRREQMEQRAQLPGQLKGFEAVLDATVKPPKEVFAKQCQQFDVMHEEGTSRAALISQGHALRTPQQIAKSTALRGDTAAKNLKADADQRREGGDRAFAAALEKVGKLDTREAGDRAALVVRIAEGAAKKLQADVAQYRQAGMYDEAVALAARGRLEDRPAGNTAALGVRVSLGMARKSKEEIKEAISQGLTLAYTKPVAQCVVTGCEQAPARRMRTYACPTVCDKCFDAQGTGGVVIDGQHVRWCSYKKPHWAPISAFSRFKNGNIKKNCDDCLKEMRKGSSPPPSLSTGPH